MGTMSMTQTSAAERPGWVRIGVASALLVFLLALVLSWLAQRRLDAVFARFDARRLDESAQILDSLVAHQRKQLSATVAVLAEDSRIRAMVLTPTFDRATALDLLGDLEATAGASVVAMLDSTGVVRAVVGAPEMDQLDLGTSSLVKQALERPAAQLWAFGDEAGVLAAAPVVLDQRVHALFLLGFALEDTVLEDIQRTLGAVGAVFVGERMVAAASKDPELERALRSAAELAPGDHRIIGERFLGSSSALSGGAVAAKVAWLVPLHRHAEELASAQRLYWVPAALAALVLALTIWLALSRTQVAQAPRG